jgi:hypothetical protein
MSPGFSGILAVILSAFRLEEKAMNVSNSPAQLSNRSPD